MKETGWCLGCRWQKKCTRHFLQRLVNDTLWMQWLEKFEIPRITTRELEQEHKRKFGHQLGKRRKTGNNNPPSPPSPSYASYPGQGAYPASSSSPSPLSSTPLNPSSPFSPAPPPAPPLPPAP